MSGWEAAENERRLANMIRVGVIADLDETSARVKVRTAGLTTDWLPWQTARAGGDRTWHAPEPGEQVLVLAPYGDLGQAVVLPSIYQDAHPAPADKRTTSRTEWSDGAYLQYDREGHNWTLDVPAGGAVTIHLGGSTLVLRDGEATLTTPKLTIDAPETEITGDVKVSGRVDVAGEIKSDVDVKAMTVSLKTHVHTGVMSGPSLTGPPKLT